MTRPGGPLEAQPVTVVSGVGAALATRLERLGIRTVQDLLFHLPARYEDRTRVLPIGGLRPGDRAVVEGELQHVEVAYRRRRSLLAHLRDGSGGVTLRPFLEEPAGDAHGTRLRAFVRSAPAGSGLEMVHPEYQLVRAGARRSVAI